MRIVVDRDLCQGHGVLRGEAPEVFSVSKKGELTVLDENPPEEQRAAGRAGREVLPHPRPTSIEED
jgi:ferredoxin